MSELRLSSERWSGFRVARGQADKELIIPSQLFGVQRLDGGVDEHIGLAVLLRDWRSRQWQGQSKQDSGQYDTKSKHEHIWFATDVISMRHLSQMCKIRDGTPAKHGCYSQKKTPPEGGVM